MAEELAKTPTIDDVDDCEYLPSGSTIKRRFGSHNELVRVAGLEPNMESTETVHEKPDDVTIPDDKEWSELSAYQRWYYKNKEKERRRTKNREKRLRKWFQKYKALELKCSECGEGHPATLDLHHIESDDKEIASTEMVRRGWSKERIKNKIENELRVLCANCHRKHHYPEKKYSYTDYEEDSN